MLAYVAELKKLATHCNFGANLNEALRDKLVCGLQNIQIQRRLLSEAKLKYSKALEIAVAMEAAVRDASELHSELHAEPRVDKISDNSKPPPPPPPPTPPPPPNLTPKVCYRCGGDSQASHNCRFKDQKCYHCGKVGHISRVCNSRRQGKPKQPPKTPQNTPVHTVQYSESDDFEDVSGSMKIHNVRKPSSNVIWVDLKVEGKPLEMESHDLYKEKFNDKPLHKTELMLKIYTGKNIVPLGVLKKNVEYKDQQALLLDLCVVKNQGAVLMGRDWLYKIRLDWYAIKSLKASQSPPPIAKERLQTMLDKYSDVFEDKLGTFKSAKANLILKEDSQAHFCKARAMPYALRPKVEEELRILQNEGILTKVECSDWATSIVPVPKKDGSVRICGDYKGTVNPELQAEQYPLPRIEDIFAKLSGGQKFSKIDLRQAYHQLEMEEDSKKYLTINTHMGLFQYNRLVFGIT